MTLENQGQLSLGLLVAAIGVGTVGYFLGISRSAEPLGYWRAGQQHSDTQEEIMEAPTQTGLATGLNGTNRNRIRNTMARLAKNRRGLTAEVERATDEEWNAEILARAKNRAYAGAPPTIPHEAEQAGFPNCLACHEEGLMLENRRAPRMSHERVAECRQCHVEENRSVPGTAITGGPPAGNLFEGVARWGRGEKAWEGAPKTIPHPILMRERCDSCHGVLATGLRTSHVYQQSCEQCHTPEVPPPPIAAIPNLSHAP